LYWSAAGTIASGTLRDIVFKRHQPQRRQPPARPFDLMLMEDTNAMPAFKGPAKYSIYGGDTPDGQFTRLGGADTLPGVHQRIISYRDTYGVYRVYECTWKEIRLDAR
jgi:hypothetical protein